MKTKRFLPFLGLLCCLAALAPLSWNWGSVLLLLLGALLCSSIFWTEKGGRRLMPLVITLLCVIFLYCAALFGCAHLRPVPQSWQNETVLVLGCKVKNGFPSPMLQRRLNAAAQYLLENPDALCVVSGGQGSDENETEAAVMARTLEALGVENARIHLEERSTNTLENFRYSLKLIEEQGLSPQLVVVSDGYHQLRAWLIAAKLGLESAAVSCPTNPLLVPSYCAREVLSLCKLLPFFLS